MRMITVEDAAGRLDWADLVAALRAGHRLPKAQVGDTFLGASGNTLLSRAAWIEGLGFGVKSVSVMPGNVALGLPSIQGAMLVFEDKQGALRAMIDSAVITNWKTAADSVLGASLLARPESRHLLIVGAGTVARMLVPAYRALFADLETISIWNRTEARAAELVDALAAEGHPVSLAKDLPQACGQADIISSATMSTTPVISGEWLPPGCHVDLIGAFKADMREVDDAALTRASLFVDSRDTTLHHIGELMIPLQSGVISEQDVKGDLYELVAGTAGRTAPEEVTIFKNGGGAHLDLMTADYILSAVS